jgi:multidrug efflux pump subunit AcrA (membrane-fusion protein)
VKACRWLSTLLVSVLLGSGVCHPTASAQDEKHESKNGKGEAKADGKGGGRGRGGPVSVRVVEVRREVSPRPVEVIAALVGRAQADVYSRFTGRVTQLGPKEGDAVKVNQVLLRIDRSDPGETFLNAPIVSPITGWLGRWNVTNVGEQVTPQDPVATVVDDRALRARLSLPAADWLEVTPKTPVTVTVESETRPAKILTIARSAESDTGRGAVLVEVDNAKHDWRVGVPAKVKFLVGEKPRLILTAMALSVTDQGAFVYVADGGVARRQMVRFELMDSDTVEILEGLKDGDQVIVAGTNLLSDKAPIKIADAEGGDKGG